MGGACIGHIKVEEVVCCFLHAERYAVGKQFHGLLVGVNSNLGHILYPIHVALAAQVDKGLVAEPCLVGIEGILLILTVEGHKALMVLAVFAALIPGVSAKVEHIPHMGSPHKLPGEQLLDQLLMVVGLVFLGVITLGGVGGMPVQRFAAILRTANGNIGVLSVEVIEPGAVHRGVTAVPAKIVVVGNHVRNLDVGRIDGTGRNRRNGGQSGLVHFVAQIVEDVVVFQQIGVSVALHGNLIGQAPNHDGGVIIVLRNQFGHLGNGVFPAGGHVVGDVGNFCPDHQALLVAQVIEILIMLIVGKPDGGAANFANQFDIFFMIFLAQRIALAPAVLVSGNAPEGILFPVEDKAVLRVDTEATAAKMRRNGIQNYLSIQQFCSHSIKIGIFPAVPQMDIRNGDVHHIAAGDLGDHIALGIVYRVTHGGACCIGPGLHFHVGVLSVHDRGYLDAGRAVIIQIKMSLVDTDQVHIPVQAAVESEVRNLGIDPIIGSVIHRNHQKCLSAQFSGQIHTPGGVTAVMMSKVLAGYIHIGRRICALDFQIIALGGGQIHRIQLLDVVGRAPEVIAAAVLSVDCIKAVRQVHKIPTVIQLRGNLGGLLGKQPFVVKIDNFAHFLSLRFFIFILPNAAYCKNNISLLL